MTGISVCPEVTRVDIAWTCVATDDPSQLHLDEEFATRAGHRSVMAPGTMLLGWVGEYLERLAGGPEGLLMWSIRLTAPVWPGDVITLSPAPPDTTTGLPDDVGGTLVATTSGGGTVARVRYQLAAQQPARKDGISG